MKDLGNMLHTRKHCQESTKAFSSFIVFKSISSTCSQFRCNGLVQNILQCQQWIHFDLWQPGSRWQVPFGGSQSAFSSCLYHFELDEKQHFYRGQNFRRKASIRIHQSLDKTAKRARHHSTDWLDCSCCSRGWVYRRTSGTCTKLLNQYQVQMNDNSS